MLVHPMSGTRRRALVLTAAFAGAACALFPAASASAQQVVRMAVSGAPGGMFGGGSRPAMTQGELLSYADLLGLDDAQREAAKELLASYTSEFEKASKEQADRLRRLSEEFRETRDDEIWQEMGPITQKFTKRAKELETTLLADLKTVCDDAQLAHWPKMERARRRDRTIDRGMVSGESVDLVRIVKGLELPESARAELGTQMEAYEQDLDRALETRNKVLEEQAEAFTPGAGPMTFDFTAVQKLMQDLREAGVKVRDVNQRYARSIEGMLPDAVRPTFALQVKQATFPTVYRQSRTSRAFDAAMKFDDLDARQKEAIDALRQSYDQEAAALNDKWAAAILEQEQEGGGGFAMGGGRAIAISFGEESPDTPAEQAKKARRDADRKALQSLESLLSETQKERLPRPGDDAGAGEAGVSAGAPIILHGR